MSRNDYSVHRATAKTLGAVGDFVASIHGEAVGRLTCSLAQKFPGMGADNVLWVRHDPTGEVVSTQTLVPWTCASPGSPLPVMETGIVATHPDHRHRGLVTWLMTEAKSVLRERGTAVSVIQGIPYFYRQSGFEFAPSPRNPFRLGTSPRPGPSGRVVPPPSDPTGPRQRQVVGRRSAKTT